MIDCAASTLDAAVTAEMTISASRTASAAEFAQRTPVVTAAFRTPFPGALRKQDVPSGKPIRPLVTKSGGNRLAGFAEADEGDVRPCVWHGEIPLLASLLGQ